MSYVVIGCDINSGADHDWQNTVASALEEQGHETEKLQIAPNPFALYSYSSKASGKIGVYIIADGLFSIGDLYYGNTSFKYAYFLIRGDLGHTRMDSYEDFKNNPIAADADTRGEAAKLAGKTFPQMNEITKDKCLTVWGGTNPQEGAKNLIKAMGGDTGADGESSPGGTVKDALKKVVSKWDGDIEVKIIEDTVYVHKIPDPTTATLTIDEYNNALYDSVTVTDANPQTVNYLTGTYNGTPLSLKDEISIERFGEQKQELTEDFFTDIKTLDEAKKLFYREYYKLRRDSGRSVEVKINGDPAFKTGQWVRVYLPSYFIDDYMYISKTSHDTDATSTWQTSLTLVDYPPSFGAYVEETTTEEDMEDMELDETELDMEETT